MDFYIDNTYDVIPESYDNAKGDAPVVFHCRALTEPEREKCLEMEFIDGKSVMHANKSQCFRLAVTGIDNLKINGKAITTAKDYMADGPSLPQMYDEVVAEIITRTTRPSVKNS